jgi:hypothetical protein
MFKNQHTALMRLEAYEGSLLHFSKSLLYRRSIEEGFSIYKNISSVPLNPKKHLSKKEREEILPTNLVYAKSTEGTLLIPGGLKYYSLPTSTTTRIFRLHIPNKRILFATNSYDSAKVIEVTLDSGTSGKKLIPRLPIDYKPPKEFPLNSF